MNWKSGMVGLSLAAALIGAGTTGAIAQAPPAKSFDMIDDRPTALGQMWASVSKALGWATDAVSVVSDYVVPPSTSSLAAAARDDQGAGFFRLLGLAGYKMKKVENVVGLIPGLSFTFGIARELSEADLDYIDEQLTVFQLENPGVLGRFQRSLVSTIIAVNTGGGLQVSELQLTLLPLPKAEFTVTPTEAYLGEEASALMRAIQRVDRQLRDFTKTSVKPSTGVVMRP